MGTVCTVGTLGIVSIAETVGSVGTMIFLNTECTAGTIGTLGIMCSLIIFGILVMWALLVVCVL